MDSVDERKTPATHKDPNSGKLNWRQILQFGRQNSFTSDESIVKTVKTTSQEAEEIVDHRAF